MRQFSTQSSKYFRKIVTFVLAFAMILTSISVSSFDSQAAKKVKKVSIGVKVGGSGILVLKKGQKKKLNVSVTPKKANKKVSYKSSKKSVVSVSSKGVVKALKSKGTAKITVTSKQNKKKKATIKVKVGTPIKKVSIANKAKTTWTSANFVLKEVNGQKKKVWPSYSQNITSKKGTFTMPNGRNITLKASVSPKKATYKKVKWSVNTKGKKLVVLFPTGTSCKVTTKTGAVGTAVITATAADGSGKKTKVKLNITKFVSDKTPAPTATPDTRKLTKVEDFESYPVGTTWDKYTAAGLNAGHMTVVQDPEDATNKCLEVKFDGADAAYDFAPVFNVDLDKIGASGKTLSSFTGVVADFRVVGTDSDIQYKKVFCYFDQYNKIDKKDKFASSDNETATAHVNKEGKVLAAGEEEYKPIRFGVNIPMAEGDDKETGSKLFNGNDSKESNKYLPQFYSTFKVEDASTHYLANSCTTGFKLKEADGKVGFANRSLTIDSGRVNEADKTLMNQSKFDIVIGSTFKGAATYAKLQPPTSVTMYVDNLKLAEEDIPVTNFDLSVEGEQSVKSGNVNTIKVKYTPENTTQKGVNWTSNNPKVHVDSEGTVSVDEDFFKGIPKDQRENQYVVITATSKFVATLSKSITLQVKKPDAKPDFTVDFESMLDKDKTETVVDADTGIEKATFTDPATGNTYEGYKIKFTKNNQRIFFKLPENLDLASYKSMEIVGMTPQQLSFDTWDESLDKTADSWWEKHTTATYPFYEGTYPMRPTEDMTIDAFKSFWNKTENKALIPNVDVDSVDLSKYAATGSIPKGSPVGPNAVEKFTKDFSDIKEGDFGKTGYVSIGTQGLPSDGSDFEEVTYYVFSLKFIAKQDDDEDAVVSGGAVSGEAVSATAVTAQ